MLRKWTAGLIFLVILSFAPPLWAQSTVQYVYDALGRLTQVIDPSGNMATYNYDAVGNLLSITRSTTSPSALAIFGFSPSQGSVGQTVTIQGQNFSATPSANTVKFNGTTATVTAATTNLLTTTVPAGTTTGLISVTVGTSTANSSTNFTVLAVPVVTSVTPMLVLNAPTISGFQVTGTNLTGATFSFLPAFTPAAIAVSNVNINGNGTSGTMTLTLASNAAGSFTVVATNGTGSSSAVPTTSNTLTVLSTDPSADFDGDGLTNIYEAAIGTNYAASSTTGDGLPDGWALFYTSTPPLNAALAGQTAPNGKTYLYSFQQGLNPLLNTVAPSVSSIFPANNATNYPTNGVIVVRFTEKMMAPVSLQAAQTAINTALPTGSNFSTANALSAAQVLQAYLLRTCCGGAAAPGAIQVSQGGRPVSGSVFLSNDQLSLTFAPAKFFSASTTFTVTVQAVRDAGGNLIAQPFTSTFTTGAAKSENTPSPLATNPPNNATGVEINTPFRVEFSRPVDPSTLTTLPAPPPQTVSVADGITGQVLPGMIQVDPFLLSASFIPAQPYAVGRTINVTLTAGVKDVTGNSFGGNTYSFTTGFVGDSQGPSQVSTSPSDTATSVPLNALIILEFNEPMDAISALTGLQLQLAGVSVPGAIALSDGNKRITLTPTSALTANTTYTVVTTPQLLDFAGNPLLTPDISTFITGATSDTTTPQVSSVNPPNNATGVPTNAVIQAQFSKAIDPITVTSATFSVSVSTSSGLQAITGTVAVSTDGLTATFSPSAPLMPETTYTIQLSNAIADMEGHALASFSSSFTTAVGTVTTSPTVIVSPPNGTTGVMVNARIEVLSSAPISKTSVTSNAIQVSTGGVNVSGPLPSLSPDQRTLTFVPTSLLAVSTTYTINVSGFTDEAGNAVVPSTTTFTTGTSGVRDTSNGSVLTVNPSNGATGVAVSSAIVLTFNKNIDPTSVNNASIPIKVSGSNAVLAGTYAVNGAVVTFTPATPLPGSATILVAVLLNPAAVFDLAGNVFNSFNSSFTTAAVADTTAPQVQSVTPVNGATGIGLNATVVLTFSKSLNPNTINANNFGLLANVGANPSLANGTSLKITVSHSADNRVVSLQPTGLLPASSTVTVVATSGVLDLSGNALVNFSSQFTTAATFDTVNPSVLNVFGQRPGNGATGVPLNTSVVFYLSEPMNTTTVQGAVHISQNGVLVAGTTAVTDNGQTIVFTPSSPFQNNALIQVFMDSTALDVDGRSLAAYQGSFRTALDPNTVVPVMVSTSPTDQASGIPTNVVIDVGFNETLNATTVNTTNVILKQNGTTIPSSVILLPVGTIIQITPSATLVTNTPYVLQVTNGVQGTNGQGCTCQSFGFTTGTGTDLVSPTITAVSPQNGLGNVGDNAAVRVAFSKPINPLTASGSAIQLMAGNTTEIADSISFGNNNQSVLLVPHAPLPDATQMTLTISGVTDLAGNQVAAQTTHFTTGTGPDVVTPMVVAQNPYNGETSVPLNTTIQLQVNDLVDAASVNSSTFLMFDTTANQSVPGAFAVSADSQTITFLPNPSLAASHNFIVGTGHRGITNLAGNLLATSALSDFTFTTGTTANTTGPQVVGMSPSNGLTGVPINAQVAIQFNEPVDALTVNQVTLSGGGNITRTLANGNQTLVLVPVLPLSPNTTYTVTIIGIQDISGNSMGAQVTQSFTTGPGADLTPPSVLTTSTPLNGATGVLRNSTIQLQFSKRIDLFMVTNSTFTVAPTSTQVPIAGTIVVSANGLTATFTPTTSLAASTTYQITATIGITDLEGQPIQLFTSQFTTGTQ